MSELPVIIVTAAGRGSRFTGRSHKLRQAFGASTVLGTTLGHALDSRLPVLVVTTQSLADEAARTVSRRDLLVLSDHEAARGMGSSIAMGVAARSDFPGWVVLPADMPLVSAAVIGSVARALGQHTAVYAQHAGHRGHPVGFSPGLYSDLVTLSGDEGARRLLARYPSYGVDTEDPGVLMDIDTEADLEAARALLPTFGLAT